MGVSEAETTGSLVWRVSMKWRAAVDRAVAPFNLTHAQYVLLATLYGLALSHQRPSQRELAEATGLEPAYVSRLSRSLEANHLIERTEAPADVRAVEVNLTSLGEVVVTRAIAAVRELHDELLEPIGGPNSPENRRFRDTLRALLRDLSEGELNS